MRGSIASSLFLMGFNHSYWSDTLLLIQADLLGDKQLELPSLVYSVHAWTCVLAALHEIYSFPESVLPHSDRIKLSLMYIPFQVVLAGMAIDMYARVKQRKDKVE
jgi:EXPERA (EXPanded EBP superfamily)